MNTTPHRAIAALLLLSMDSIRAQQTESKPIEDGNYFRLTVTDSKEGEPITFPYLAGEWKMGGPYNIGLPCHILQTSNYLIFVNEKGEKCRGVIKNPTEIIALDWEGGLNGTLTNSATRINWKNGTWWIKQ